MADFTYSQIVSVPGASVSVGNTVSAGLLVSLNEPALGSATTQMIITLDVSCIRGICISSDVALTLKTNSSGSPANTIVIQAGIPYVWTTTSYSTLLLTTDVTSMFFVNATVTDANVKVIAVVDPTP